MARVAFVVTTCHEFEGIKALSATLKQHGHETDCFITSEERDFHGAVERWRPDVLGIYATTGQERWARPHVRRWRRALPQLRVVMGGPHPSFYTDVLHDDAYVDATVKGEAEHGLLDLVEAWAGNRSIADVPNAGFLEGGVPRQNPIRPIVQDLDTLPFPDVEPFYKYRFLRNKRVLQVHASRGCQNNCTYCTVPLMKKEWVSDRKRERFNRTKSVDYLCEELNDVLARYPRFRMVNFGDAALNMYRGWIDEFAEKWPARVGLPFACNVNINYLNENDIVCLKRAGCVSVQFGLESGSEDVRLNVYKKGYTDEVVERIPRLLRKHRISFRTNNMMGSPAETIDDMFATARANRRIRPAGCTVLIYRPFKSTVLGREDYEKGRVDVGKDIGPSLHHDSQLRRGDVREVVNLQKLFNVAVYLPGGEALVRRLVRLPRNRAFEWVHLAFLWYQHAVVSGYGMADDLVLGLKNLGQIFGERIGGTDAGEPAPEAAAATAKNQFLDCLDTGLDASV